MRLWGLAAWCLDGDEIFSLGLARQGWGEMTSSAIRDTVHPPLLYYFLKVWISIGGQSLFWFRLFPMIACTLALWPIILLARRCGLKALEICLVVALAAPHPYLVYYSQHVRMYALLLMFGMWSLYIFSKVALTENETRRRRLIAFTIVNIVLLYSHYYGIVVIAFECLFALIWKRRLLLSMITSALVTLIAFAPWIYGAVKSAQAKGGLDSNLGWIQKPSFPDLMWYYVDLSGAGSVPRYNFAAPVLIVLGVAALFFFRRNQTRVIFFLALFAYAPAVFSFAVSQFTHNSIWGHRHLIFCVPPFLMLATLCMTRLATPVGLGLGALAVLWAGLMVHQRTLGIHEKVPWDSLVLTILDQERGATQPVEFYSLDQYLHYPVWFFLENLKAGDSAGFAQVPPRSEMPRLSRDAAMIKVRRQTAVADLPQTGHFWVAFSSSWAGEPVRSTLKIQRGCRVGDPVVIWDKFHWITAFPAWCGT